MSGPTVSDCEGDWDIEDDDVLPNGPMKITRHKTVGSFRDAAAVFSFTYDNFNTGTSEPPTGLGDQHPSCGSLSFHSKKKDVLACRQRFPRP